MATRIEPVDGLIVIRVWFEDHPEFPLRAVVTTTTTDGRQVASARAKSTDEVCAAVLAALEQLSGAGQRHVTGE